MGQVQLTDKFLYIVLLVLQEAEKELTPIAVSSIFLLAFFVCWDINYVCSEKNYLCRT